MLKGGLVLIWELQMNLVLTLLISELYKYKKEILSIPKNKNTVLS